MRVMTFNANGIRAAARKGFFDWLARQRADVVCIQETKAQASQLADGCYWPPGFHSFYHGADKKGYSGVALYTAREPRRVHYGIGWPEMDSEGRYLQADFDGLSVISLYLPSGTAGDERQQFKYRLLDRFLPYLRELHDDDREYIICGDWNIAHTANDIKNWRSNQNNSGFLPEERAWMDKLFGDAGFVDAFRELTDEPDYYTWWSYRGRAWEKNVGWRIDYQVVTPGLREAVNGAEIYAEERFSDHAPLTMDYDLALG